MKIDSKLSISILMISLALFGCSEEEGGRRGFSMPPTPVEVAPATTQEVIDRFEAVGTIEAVASILVVGEIDAAVIQLPFKEGSDIQRGELIAQLDDSQLAAEVARARALRAQSKATYDRVKSIVEQGAGAPQDLDDAAAALKVADANLALAKARFAKTRVVAPFNGTIGARAVSIGTFLRAGQKITELANIDEIRVNFSAPERFLSKLKQGADVTISTTAYPGYNLEGKIIVVEPVLDTATRSARLVAQVENPERKFRAGMSADVSAVLSARPDAITIPNESVFAKGSQSFAYVVNADSTVSMTALILGTRTSDYVEVVEGLKPGVNVVRAGHQKLFDGAKVMPITSNGSTSANQ